MYILYYKLMILLRNLKNPLLHKTIFYHPLTLVHPYATISKDSKNILKGLSTQKIIKLSSSKKCNTAQDVMFCNFILESLLQNNINNEMELHSIETQVTRLLTNSLPYIQELSLLETLFLANNCLQLIKIKRIKINNDILNKFLEKININIKNLIKKSRDGKYLPQIVKYIQFLVISKRSSQFTKTFLDYIVSQPKKQRQVIQILNLLIQFKHKNNIFLAKSVKKILQQQIAQKIQSQGLQSPLIDTTILKIFVSLKLSIKKPYNCIPQWLFIFTQKLKQKYQNPKYQIPISKKIQFIQNYIKFIMETNLMTEVSLVSSKDYLFMEKYLNTICEEFDYIDGNIYHTITYFANSLNNYLIFIKKYPVHLNDLTLIQQTIIKIFDRYFHHINYSHLKPQLQQTILKSFIKYLQIFTRFLTIQSCSISQAQLYKIFNRSIEILHGQLSRHHSQPSKYQNIFSLLECVGLQYQRLLAFEGSVNISTAYNSMKNVVYDLDVFFARFNSQKIDQIYVFKHGGAVDFVTISYLFIIWNLAQPGKNQDLVPKSLARLLKHLQKTNLSCIIQSFAQKKFKKGQLVQQQILRLCQLIKSRTLNLQFSHPSKEQWIQEKTLTNYTYISEQEQLVGNIIHTLRNIESCQLFSVYKYWLIDNSDIIYKFWCSDKNPYIFELSWNLLIKNIRYLYSISNTCGIDFVADVMRIWHKHKSDTHQTSPIVGKFIQLFDDRSVSVSFTKKFDQFTFYKYMWMITLLTEIKTQQKLDLQQDSPVKIRKKNTRTNQISFRRKQDNQQQNLGSGKEIEYQVDLLQFEKLKEFIIIIVHDLKEPLQIAPQSFKAGYVCRIINWCMMRVVNYIKMLEELYKKDKKQIQENFQKRKYILLSDIPVQQIIYYLSLNNELQKAYWLQQLSISFLIAFLKPCTKTCQYNILLSFPRQKEQTKKTHEVFLSKQLQKYNKNTKQKSQQPIAYPSVLKYYYHLVGADPREQKLRQNVEMITRRVVFTDREVLDYWLSKNIVVNTVHDSIVQAMLARLLSIHYAYGDGYEITYPQFSIILNTIITMLQNGRINKYKVPNTKQNKQLVGWVHGYLELKSQSFQHEVFLPDYISITRYFGRSSRTQWNVDKLMSTFLQRNKIHIVDLLYRNRYILNQECIANFKSLIVRALDRCLGEDYYGLDFNSEFRVEIFLIRVFGIVLMQNNTQLLQWFKYQILNRISTQNMEEYLYKQQNSDKLLKVFMLNQISNKRIISKNNTPIQMLLQKLTQQETKNLQQKISQNQRKKHLKIENAIYEPYLIPQSGLNLFKKQNTENLVYFVAQSQLTTDDMLEIQYIKLFLGNHPSISLIFLK